MQQWLEAWAKDNPPREILGNNPLRLDESDGAWFVRSGRVDVFALSPSRDGRAGARRHLLRVEAGAVLFGVGGSGAAAHGGLLAVGSPGTRVLPVARQQFEQMARRPETAAPLAALVDAWLSGLTTGVARDRAPKQAVFLEPGREAQLPPGGAVGAARGVVWVRCLEGSSLFLDKADAPLTAADGPFPLAGPGWLAAGAAGARVSAAATEAVLGDGQMWAALDRFHRSLLSCMTANLADAAAAESDRLARREEAERRLTRATLSQFAGVAGGGAADGAAAADEDPLLAACRLVGGRLGVAIQAPPGAGERGRRSDPVSAIARASRVRVRRVMLSGDWWRQDNGPLLAFRAEDDRPVALLPASPSRYDLIDPAAGARTRLTAAGAASILPFGYSFYRPFPERALRPRDLVRFGIRGGRRDWLLVVLLGLAAGVLGMLVPIVTGWVFDRIIPGGDRSQLLVVILALTASTVATAIFQLARGVAMLRVETRMDASVQAGVWDRLLNLPAPFFRRFTAGDLAARASGIGAIREVLTDVALSSVLSFVFTLVYFGLLFYYDVRLALLACVLFLVVLLTTSLSAFIQLRYQRGIYQARGKISGLVLQLLTGVPRLRVAGAEERALAVWGREFSAQKRLAFRARSAANNLAAFNAALPILNALVLFGAVSMLPHGALSLGAFLAFSVAFVQVLSSAIMLGSTAGYAVEIVPLYERAKPILDAAPEVDVGKAAPSDLSGDVEMSHVSFRYRPAGPLILDDVSLRIRPGEFVAFVGPSGAGKSTIIRLLLGFESPTAGSVHYDREDLAALDRQAVRRQIGVVLQDGKTLSGDIFTNIIGSSLLTLDDAWEAAYLAGMADEIQRMPMEMHTVISDGGSTLSGGQRQRLMIARAVVAKPRILLFDEATSALDNETQARVSRSLENLKATRIVVAHRLSTVVHADRIYVMSAGRIVQQGRHEDLMKEGGLFAELMRRQMA